MKPFVILLVSCFSNLAFSAAIDLQKSFEIAVDYNEAFKIQQKELEKSREVKKQAVGSVLPKVSGIATYTRQDTSNLTTSQRNAILDDATTTRLNATQSLFRGTQEYAAWRAANRGVEAEEFTLLQTKRDLYSQVATQFYLYLRAKKDLVTLKNLLDLTEKRGIDLQKRAKVGRVRKGELLQSRAQAASARALVIEGQTAMTQAQTAFFQLTGIRETELVDSLNLPSGFPPIETYLGKLEERPDIEAYKKRAAVSDELVSAAWGAHLPTIDATANYYLDRPGSSEKIKWDAGLVLTLPLFEGGVTQSKVREASAAYAQSEIRLDSARRAAEKQVRDLYTAVNSGVQQLQTLKEAAQLAEENYREQTKDNRFGLVTSLEVIAAMNTYIESVRDLDRVTYQVKTAYAHLRAATGAIP